MKKFHSGAGFKPAIAECLAETLSFWLRRSVKRNFMSHKNSKQKIKLIFKLGVCNFSLAISNISDATFLYHVSRCLPTAHSFHGKIMVLL